MLNKLNKSCYEFEKINTNSGILDKSIDATYIIHLVNNGRLQNIKNQLNNFHITKTTYILHNKGYKKCNKDKNINTSSLDLIDSFITIFKDSINKGYNNILILEDDFMFNNKIKNKYVYEYINNFINKKKMESFVYFLGAIPYLQTPYDRYSNILLLSTGTHSCIYSKKFIEYTLNTVNKNNQYIKDWDIYLNFNSTRYIYYIPLCYQIFYETENSKNWEKYYLNSGYLLKKLFIFYELNKKVEPGYSFFYNSSKLLFFCIIILLIIIIIYLIKIYNLKKYKFKKLK